MENILELRTINELNQHSFYIPSYQRGYKWSDNEVTDLLNDINEFKPRQIGNTDERTWYCLQPIVVKNLGEKYEVIDGQQRLTTIFLILNYLNQDFVPSKRDKLFDLDYQTRKDTRTFLNTLGTSNTDEEHDYIDFFYIKAAYRTIDTWFTSQPLNFDQQDFRSKFKFHSKVIWYESTEPNPIAIFTRINIGKIPLTNAELIKALFLNSSNFDGDKKDKLKLKQLEISTEWDHIEHTLQNDRMWFFLTGSQTATNRIEFIFNLMNEEEDRNDNYSTFRFFNKKFQQRTQETIEGIWSKIKDYFQRFNEWFNERDLYHKIGFLVCIKATTIKELYHKSSITTKTEFREYLDKRIRAHFQGVQLEELQYGDTEVSQILLLYNILTMLSSEKDNSYFPFDIYKNERWDIEHITSVKDAIPEKNREQWLSDAVAYVDRETLDGVDIVTQAKVCKCEDDSQFKELFEKIVAHFNSRIDDEDINDLSNLTLLDSDTNRSYKNAVFPFKRKTIIDRDKAGVFIPLCTKNVFLKYFSDYPPKISFWTQDDRQKYEDDLYRVLAKFLNIEA